MLKMLKHDPLCLYFYSVFKSPISQNYLYCACIHLQTIAQCKCNLSNINVKRQLIKLNSNSNSYISCKMYIYFMNCIQVALVICGLFICDFTYMRSKNDLFSGTYPLIISHSWSFYMQFHYMRVYFWSPYLSHITRSNCSLVTVPWLL